MDSNGSGSGGISTKDDFDRVYLRLAMCNSDEQLQKFTDSHLVNIILFAMHNTQYTTEVGELLSHLNKRVRSNENIRFPVNELVKIIASKNTVASNLAMVYLKYSKDRLSSEEHIALLPIFLETLDVIADDEEQANRLLLLCLPGFVALSKIEKRAWPSSLTPSPNRLPLARVLRFFSCILAFPTTKIDDLKTLISFVERGDLSYLSALSSSEFLIIARHFLTASFQLAELKLAIIRICSEGFVEELQAFPLFVLASAAQINVVDDAAESALKKLEIQKCVDSSEVIQQLYFYFLGSAAVQQQQQLPLDKQVKPANLLMKQKLLPFFNRSTIAATMYMNNLKVYLDGLTQPAVSRIISPSLLFLVSIIESMPAPALGKLGPSLFAKITHFHKSNDLTPQVQCLVFRVLSVLGSRLPSLILSDSDLIPSLFSYISSSHEDVSYSVVDCLVSYLPTFSLSEAQNFLTILRPLVSTYLSHPDNKSRLVALKYAESLLSPNEIALVWDVLLLSGDSRDEVRKEAYRLLDVSLAKCLPNLEELVEFVLKQTREQIVDIETGEELQPTPTTPILVFRTLSRYLWCMADRDCGGKSKLEIAEASEEAEEWRVTAPRVTRRLAKLQIKHKHILNVCLQSLRDAADEYSLYTILSLCHAFRPLPSLPFALSLATRQVHNFNQTSTSSLLAQLITFLTPAQQSQKLFEEALCELKTKSGCQTSYLAAARATTEEQKQQLAEALLKHIEGGYNAPNVSLEFALGSATHLLSNMENSIACASAMIKICEQIASSRKEIFSMKMREKAIEVIGLVNTQIENDQLYEECISSLLRIGEGPPQLELHLSVGSALFHSALGLYSPLRRDPFEKSEAEITLSSLPSALQPLVSTRLISLLERILNCKCNQHLHLRRASFAWLLVLVQKVALFDSLLFRAKLQLIQESFCDGLTESNEFVQELASRGLGAVYEMAGEDLKKELVGTLLSAITEGRRTTAKVQSDSVVFEDGELGKAPDGSSLSTYKALCDLATDMNQPDLIYKFMQLAKHNATWNSKKGAAFGFGALLEHAREELEPYFGQLVPKIFRYRYDPDMKLQMAFKGIWNALTKDKKNVIDQFADEIAKELLANITNKEWRVRESCCLALSDLLRGHDTPYIHSRLPEIFEVVLRLKDDVKESVRVSADRSAESVRRLCLRQAASSNEAKSQAFLSQMLPVILNCATQSPIKINKAYGLALIIELCKTSGSHLRPHAAVLIPQLLESISDNESAVLNYIAARSNEAQLEALDDARASLARTSPMMQAVNDLLPQIDSSVLVAMQPRLSELLHSSVGVSTRSAAAQFVTMLSLRAPQLLLDHRQQCDKLFHSIVPSLRDRNPSVRKQMASTASHLAKFVSANEISALMRSISKDLVSDKEDMKQGARHVLRSLSHNCPELLSNFATQIVPYIFLGKCLQVEKGDEVGKKRLAEWEELWTEIVPSTNAAVRLYGNEIFELGLSTLKESDIWSVRTQAARMLEEAVKQLKGSLDAGKAGEVITLLLPLLSGRIWAGKESILTTIRAILEANPIEFRKTWSEETKNQVKSVLQREASKKNKPYVTVAVQTAAAGAASFKDREWAETLQKTALNNVARILKDEKESSEEDMESAEREAVNAKYLEANLLALILLLQTYEQGTECVSLINIIRDYFEEDKIVWKIKYAMVQVLRDVVESWECTNVDVQSLSLTLVRQADFLLGQQRSSVAQHFLQVLFVFSSRRNSFLVEWSIICQLISATDSFRKQGIDKRALTIFNQHKSN